MDGQTFGCFRNDFHLQASQNTLNGLYRNVLTDQTVDLVVSQFYGIRLYRIRINILDRSGNLTTGYFLDQQSGTFQYIDRIVRIQTAFEAERSIGVQTEATGCLTNPCRMETSRFKEYIRSLLRHT